MKRVAIYCRVSTAEQAEEGYSIPEQKERLMNYCRAHGWIIHDIYIDPGYSGENLERPAMQKLISEVQDFDIVLVYKLDRLSRNTLNSLRLIEEIFKKNNITFVSIAENIDSSTPNGIMMLSFLASIAQREKEIIKERTAMGREGRAKKGLFHGSGVPIGYDYVNGQLVVNEYEAMQVREAYSLYLQGHGVRKISEILREEKGYRHKYGNWFSTATVNNVLTAPIYIGKIKWNGNLFDGQHEKIIEPEAFQQVQEMRDSRVNFNKKCFQTAYLLSGFLFCGFCGGRFFAENKDFPQEKYIYKYYKCYSRAGRPKYMVKDPNCKNKIWRVEKLDSIIEKKILHLSFEEFKVKKSGGKKEPDKNKKIIEEKIKEITWKINKLLDLYQIDNTSEIKEIGEKISRLHEEKKALEENLKNYKEEKEPAIISKEFKNFVNAIPEKWEKSDLQEKRRILEVLIEKIIIKGEEVKIVWRENFYVPIPSPYRFD